MNALIKAIKELVDYSITALSNQAQALDLGMVEGVFYERILNETGKDLPGYVVTLDNYGILHALKRHSHETETNQQQTGIGKDDFCLLLQIIFEADRIIDGGFKNGKNSIVFEKTLSGKYVAMLEIRTVTSKKKDKKNRLVLQTLYIKKLHA